MLKYCIVKQKGSRRVIYVSHTHAHAHTPLLQRSPRWWLICLEGSLHFSSEHYADTNEGDIHSALSFVSEQKRDGQEGEWYRERRKETQMKENQIKKRCVCVKEKKIYVCMNKKWRLLKAGREGGNVICVCACICVQSTENGSHIGSQIKRLMGWISIKQKDIQRMPSFAKANTVGNNFLKSETGVLNS